MFTENGKPPKTTFDRNFTPTQPPDLVEPPSYCTFDNLSYQHLLKKQSILKFYDHTFLRPPNVINVVLALNHKKNKQFDKKHNFLFCYRAYNAHRCFTYEDYHVIIISVITFDLMNL